MSIQAYLIDAFAIFAASALAVHGSIRAAMCVVIPLAANKLLEKLGYGWGNTLLAGIGFLFISIPVFVMKYGESVRQRDEVWIKKL
jgi:hypothetical protein